MRVLHIVTRSHRRGAEMAALDLAQELDVLGHQNRVVALGPALDGGRDRDFPVLSDRVGLGPRDLAPSVWRLRRLIDRDPVDVVLSHGGSAAQVAALARRRSGPPVVWQRILSFPPGFWRTQTSRRRWWERVVDRIDAAVALTPQLAHEVRQLCFTGPIWMIANSRRPKRFLAVERVAEARRLRREIGVGDDVPLLGFVGHLVDQKRPERTLDVLTRVLAQGQDVHLVIAGDGALRGALEQETRERGLGAHVSLLGHRNDVERVLGGIDLLLLTSDAEGIPGVAIEAQMAGCVVVSFPLGGVASVVEDGHTGVVLTSADTELMAAHAMRLLQSPDLRRRFGEEGRRRAPMLSTARAAREYIARFQDLLAPGTDVPPNV